MHGNIFQTPDMYGVYQNTKNYEPVFLAVVNNVDEIAGILLVVIQKEYSGVLGIFTARSIIHGGPLIKDDNLDVLDFILKEYDKIIKIVEVKETISKKYYPLPQEKEHRVLFRHAGSDFHIFSELPVCFRLFLS